MAGNSSVWIFGYGSLIYRPSFSHSRREPGTIDGFIRRFWQGSPDHRGTPESPGRVVTLVPEQGARCRGVAFEIAGKTDDVLAALDEREQGGYRRIDIDVDLDGGETISAITYYADAENAHYLGEAPVGEIASVVRRSVGPSGTNRDYVLKLAAALVELGSRDPHVDAIAALL